jgi:uncharacterized damage-inducible protein DinB
MSQKPNPDELVRGELSHFLTERNAHVNLDDVTADFPAEHVNARIEGVEYTPWRLLEHIRLTQDDVIEFIKNPDYQEPEWPKAYWPNPEAEADGEQWQRTVEEIKAGLQWLKDLLADEKMDLYRSLPLGTKYTIFREVLVILDHNSHHLGQLVMFRKQLGIWHQKS